MAEVLQPGRSLAETPTYSVASVVAVMVFVCLLVERSIYRFGEVNSKGLCVVVVDKWLINTSNFQIS